MTATKWPPIKIYINQTLMVATKLPLIISLNLLKILNDRKKLIINFPANPKPNSAKNALFYGFIFVENKKRKATINFSFGWCSRQDLNPQLFGSKPNALSSWTTRAKFLYVNYFFVVLFRLNNWLKKLKTKQFYIRPNNYIKNTKKCKPINKKL